MFEWDERKRLANIAKHGVDFVRAKLIFDGPTLEGRDDRRNYGEARIGAYGEVDGDVFYVVYTWRGSVRRIISARKAGSNERQAYHARIASEGQPGE